MARIFWLWPTLHSLMRTVWKHLRSSSGWWATWFCVIYAQPSILQPRWWPYQHYIPAIRRVSNDASKMYIHGSILLQTPIAPAHAELNRCQFKILLQDNTPKAVYVETVTDSGFGTGALGGAVCTLFASRSTASPSGARFFSLSFSLAAASFSFCACLRASLSFLSFSFRRAFDSYSCQSPSKAWSLQLISGYSRNIGILLTLLLAGVVAAPW